MTNLSVCSLFSGVAGLELGLGCGFVPALFCESDPDARAVLARHFPDVEISPDVKALRAIPRCDVLTAGWPCQDLSQAGRVSGIVGERSGLVGEVFRLLKSAKHKPRFVLLENVAFALHLQGGDAVDQVTSRLCELGYRWAYRVLDSRYFGVPQRRRRVFILASLDCDPTEILFAPTPDAPAEATEPLQVGFYWTEGNRGLGWTPEAVPPLKGGSGLSIPSPPAIWDKARRTFLVPGLTDAERLQGLPENWTRLDGEAPAQRARWRLVGNAVNVRVARWLGDRLTAACRGDDLLFEVRPEPGQRRHNAGFGDARSTRRLYQAWEGPGSIETANISQFGLKTTQQLSRRAATGFLRRYSVSSLRKNADFIADLDAFCSEEERSAA